LHFHPKVVPIKLSQPQPGVFVYDLGQNFAGWVKLKVSGNKGDKIRLRYAENLKGSRSQSPGMLDVTSNNLAKPVDVYILKGGAEEIYQPRFTYHGFRYVELTGYPGQADRRAPDLQTLTGQVVHSNCKPIGHFECSDELVNQIHRNTLWSQRSNMVGYPMDCPQRDERLGWMGDAHVTAEEAMLNFDMPLFYKNWLAGIRDNQNQLGDIPYISPRPFTDGFGTPAWSSAYILILWYYYQQYGDTQILAEHYNAMKKYVDYLTTTAKDHILPKDKYGDWVSANADGWWKPGIHLSVATGYYFYNAQIVSNVARILGKAEDAEFYLKLSKTVKSAYQQRFYDPKTGQYEIGSQFANSYPLFLDITPESEKDRVLQNLINNILNQHSGHLTTGILGTKYMPEALARYNRGDIVWLMLTQPDYPGWAAMFKIPDQSNRTTLSERWNQGGSNNHVMFGSIDSWFYRGLAGINIDESAPGYQKIVIKPYVPPGLAWVRAEVNSIKGLISSKWNYQNNQFELDILIPGNTTAKVYVLAKNVDQVTESGTSKNSAPNVKFIQMQQQYAVFEVGSGAYSFISRDVKSLIASAYVATPVITPGDSCIMAPETATIKIESTTEGAKIYYTLNGTEPDENSNLYQQPFQVKETSLITARAFKIDCKPSFSQSSQITFVDPVKNGLEYQLFLGAWSKLPDFKTLKPNQVGRIYKFDLKDIKHPKYNFALNITGFIEITQPGEYTFYTQSNDGSQLFIDEKLLVDNDGEHPSQEKKGKIFMKAGKYPIQVTYFQTGGSVTLHVLFEGPALQKQPIPATSLFFAAD